MRIDGEHLEPLRLRNDHDDEPPARPQATRAAHAYEPPHAVDEHAQRQILAFLIARESLVEPDNDDTLVLAMTKGAEAEAMALAKTAHGHVTVVRGGPGMNADAADGSARSFDLSTREGMDGFAATLGVPSHVANEVSTTLSMADIAERDELAEIAKAWAPAERGERSPSRLLVSGHGGTRSVFGDQTGWVNFSSIARLAHAMPNAAARVEDVFVSACFQGHAANIDVWIQAFPNLRTVHGYRSYAPERDITNIRTWEAATRGHAERRVALPIGNSWTRHDGFFNKEQQLHVVRRQVAALDVFDSHFKGEEPSPRSGALSNYYVAIKELENHSELSASERLVWSDRVTRTMYLRHYPGVAECFAADHAAVLRTGYASLGTNAPDFSRMGRKQALEAIADAERRAAALPPRPATRELLRVLRELKELKSDHGKNDLRFP